MNIFQKISYIAEVEFSDIVEIVEEFEDKLHGFEKEVIESSISNEPEEAIREILIFSRKILQVNVSESTTTC